MKNKILYTLFTCFCFVIAKAQNPNFYQQHPSKSNVSWYYQLNINPVIIRSGVITSENQEPSWYKGFQFLSCPGIFNSVSDAYNYLHTDANLLESGKNSYYNRETQNKHGQHFTNFKEILGEARAYSSDKEATRDGNAYVLSGCREQVVFSELYLKLDTTEIVMLQAGAMYLYGYNSNSSTDIKMITDAMVGINVDINKNYGVEYTVLIKEGGKWKYADINKLDALVKTYLTDFSFMQNSKKYPRVIVESRVNSSKVRTYRKL